jgi:hypothetical protein
VFDSPLINLFTALCGLAIGVLVMSSVLAPHWPVARRWVVATSAVVFVVLGVGLPSKLHASLDLLDGQHDTNSKTYEQQAQERCLNDMGRPDLAAALAFARDKMGGNAHYYAQTSSRSLACIVVNLMPSRPVRLADFDPARDWIVLDGVAPDQLGPELADEARQKDRFLSYSDSFSLLPPEAVAQ